MFRCSRLPVVLWLVIVIACSGTPSVVAAGRGGVTPPLRTGGAPERVQTPPLPADVRAVASDAGGVTFTVTAPWQELSTEPVTADGQSYVRVRLPGWAATSDAGAPALPVLTRSIGAPIGADVTVHVTAGRAHTISLPAAVLPAAGQAVDWSPPAADGAPALPQPRTLLEANASIYAAGAPYPPHLAAITSDGLLRQQRVVGVTAYPVQYDPVAQVLTVYETLTVEVSFGDRGPGSGNLEPGTWNLKPEIGERESEAYEGLLQRTLLNYEAARGWRAARETSAEAAADAFTAADALPWTPPVPGWRVTVREDGMYRLTHDDLLAAGVLAGDPDPRTFRLFYLGGEVAIEVTGEDDGVFDATDAVVFYGQAVANNKTTRDNVYWLAHGGDPGRRMPPRDGTPAGAATPASHRATLTLETNAVYRPGAPGDELVDRWFWDYVYPPSKPSWNTSFELPALAGGDDPATLRITLLGGIDFPPDPDHRTQITLNGTLLEDVSWDGKLWRTSELTFPQSLLSVESNTLQVDAPIATGMDLDLVFVDQVELTYTAAFTAIGDELAFSFDAGGEATGYEVGPFSTDRLAAYDVTDPLTVAAIQGVAADGSGPYTARFEDASAGQARYRVLADTAYRPAIAIEADTPSDLRAAANGADWIAITHADFLSAIETLRDHRAAQGLRAVAVDVQDAYDEFGFGLVNVGAIRDFLAYAYASWEAPAPSYALLVGDGHYDPKDYRGYGRTNFIPSYLAPVDPWLGETAGDNRYVTVSGADALPDLMLGRLTVNTAADAGVLIDKIIAYETSPEPGDWLQQVLAVADNADGAGNFPAMSESLLADHLPPPYAAERVHYTVTHQTVSEARAAIVAGINAGKLIVNYIGHAAEDIWASEGLLRTADVRALTNGARLPVMLPMTCYDGYYIYPYPLDYQVESLAEIVTGIAGRGAIASWSPTGLGIATGHDLLDRGFFDAIFGQGLGTLGAGTAAGKLNLFATGMNLDLLDTYLLFGDPATRLPTPCAAPAAAAGVAIGAASATDVTLAWGPAGAAPLYQVWRRADDPYFEPAPGAACTEANGCTWRSAPSFTHAGGLGDAAANLTYLVLPVSACGAPGPASNRTGEFDYGLTPGD